MMHLFLTALRTSALQFCLYFGVFVVLGIILTTLSIYTNRMLGRIPYDFIRIYLFEMIGVPVHEFCHVFFCKLFAHKVKKVQWFDAKSKGGVQGSVTHSFHPWNPYQRLGHFFIGLGPAILSPFLISALMMLLVPATRGILVSDANLHASTPVLWTSYRSLLHIIGLKSTWASYGFWIFAYIAACIVSQIELSKADLQQAAQGIIPVFLALLLFNILNLNFHFTATSTLESSGRIFFSWILSVSELTIALSFLNIGILFFLTSLLPNRVSKNTYK